MAAPLSKEVLKVKLANAREELSAHNQGLHRSLSLVDNVKRGFRLHPAAWFGGAAVIGLLLSRIPARTKEVKIKGPKLRLNKKESVESQAGKAAFVATAVKFALDLAKPALMRWARERMANAGVRRDGTRG
jgi:hypothetical protein